MRRLRVLITGFRAFPGAPHNPTPALVDRLMRLRRPALAEVERIAHVFAVSYAAVDQDLPALLAKHQPDAVLMFGLAARTPYLRIESRARNAVTQIWPDAAQTRLHKRTIAGTQDTRYFGPHTLRLLRAAKTSGIDARLSRDAGSYLCNYLSWRALEACERANGPALAAFIHVPLTAHDGRSLRGIAGRISIEGMVQAGEALLTEMVKAARQARQQSG